MPTLAEARTRHLLGVLVLSLSAIDVVAVLARLVMDRALITADLPIASLALANFAGIFWLNRTRFYRTAAFLFCLTPVWLNLVEGLRRPDGPVWYALLPMATILGAAFLRFRSAALMGILGVLSAAVVVLRSNLSADVGTPIVMYVALTNSAALGLAVFRQRIERAHRAEVERLAAQLASTERLESIGRLAGGIAHDFNNLLTVILSGTEAARDGEMDALDDVLSASTRAATLTRQLLTFSRQSGGKPIPVAVDTTIDGVRPLLRRLLPENIELDVLLDASVAVLLADQQLEQILFNLAANGRDAMSAGGTLTIRTRLLPAGDAVEITVGDTGIGMDADTSRHVLEPFFTTKPLGQGTGLGLSTVHGIVQQAGGSMELDSAPGKGTRVRLVLPRTTASERAAEPVAPPTQLSGLVLLVEDEAMVQRATGRVLEELGLSVLTASRGAEVAAVLARAPGPIALLITDVVMPGQSGAQLVRDMRSSRPTLPVLFVSGYSNEDLGSLLSEPYTRFLPKPFTRAALAEVVGALLEAGRSPAS